MPPINDKDRARLKKAWASYCTALQEEGDRVIAGELGDAADGNELAEALRSVARIGIMSLQHRLEFNDPDFPLFFRALDDRYKYGGPDAYISYFMATLRGDATYRVHAQHHGRELNIGSLWNPDITPNADGSIDIIVSAKSHPGNWVKIAPELRGDTTIPAQYPMASGGLTVRTYYWDWNEDVPPGWLTIERIDKGAPDYPVPLTAARLADQIENAAALFRAAAHWWTIRAGNIRAWNPVNELSPPSTIPPGVKNYDQKAKQGNTPLIYGVCPFELAPDEALVMETELPDAPYWSFQAYNAWWESPDHQHRQTSLNHTQAFVDPDGKARFVLAHRDPGVPNWLDTGEARRGFIFYRWWRAKSKLPQPVATWIKFDDIRNHLPSGHPRTTPAERKAALAQRKIHMAKRYQR